MKKELDIATWKRKEHFEFFSKFDEPFFGLTADVDCTKAYDKCKKEGVSFFLYYLYLTGKTVNAIEEFKYRIEDEKVYIYDKINASATISREDKTFGFSHIIYDDDLSLFLENANKESERIRSGEGLMLEKVRQNEIHCSAIPWVKFSSLSHSRNFGSDDSCPKVSYGKLVTENGKKIMPVSVHVHHALMDGYHLGLFFEKFQELLDS